MTTIAPDRPLEQTPDPLPWPSTRLRRRRGADQLAYVGLLVGTAALYLWSLGDSGWANSFYSAAAQAGSESWKAFFFGASDAAGSITVDKPPLALWPMALSVRLFGLSSWSILVPQALMGVASVAVLVALVRRATGNAWAGLLAGLALAVTPVAALMFRFNNPDALLTLLMLGAGYATLRAIGSEKALRWLLLGGGLLGLAFLTKTLQAFLVLPAFALTYAIFAALPWRARLVHLLAASGAMVAGAGWWVAIVELWPTSWWGSRPYIGGSQSNDFLELTFGYNGFGRLTGDETGSVGGGMGWGTTGVFRLLGPENGTQVAWLLPGAVVLGVAALVWGSRSARAASTLLLGWLVVTAATFSFMAGIYHAYYTVALAPAIAGCVALGAWVLWQHRRSVVAMAVLGFTVSLTAAWSFVLLERTPDYLPWLRWTIVVLGFAASLMVVGVRHLSRRVSAVVALVALSTALAGPTAYAVSTAATTHTGSIPSAGPSSSGGFGGAGGGVGGLLDGSTSTSALTSMLLEDADSYDWVAATVGANSAAGYQLATERPVMPIGGFNGSDPSPTLQEFQAQVVAGRVHYFIAGGGGLGGGPGAGGGQSSEIATWVGENFTARTVDDVTVYDLSNGVDTVGP